MTRAPRIEGDRWFNSAPLAEEHLKGKVALVDFWTYSCVNCLRTMPYLKAWWKKYGKRDDFVIIGVHTPEFEFEKEPENVKKVVEDIGITWPVVLDNDKKIWNAFANRFWPAKYLIGRDGQIIYTHFGEGGYKETEEEIQRALGIEEPLTSGALGEHEHSPADISAKEGGNVCFAPTPETYCGYERGSIANEEGYQEEAVFNYTKPEVVDEGSIGLEGRFFASAEYVEPREKGAALYLGFRATEVNLVIRPREEDGAAIVRAFVDDREITRDIAGSDVQNGHVAVTTPRMYNLLRSNKLVDGTLALEAAEGAFQAYAFTFSGCEGMV